VQKGNYVYTQRKVYMCKGNYVKKGAVSRKIKGRMGNITMKARFRGNLLLLLTAMIWGAAFVAQSVGMDYVGPFTFNGVRFLIGGIVLIPFIWLKDKRKLHENIAFHNKKINFFTGKLKKEGKTEQRNEAKTLLIGGICCGVAVGAASSFQQIGIVHTTVGKAGFITALYIVFVPLFGIFLKKRIRIWVWLSVVLSAVGLYLLCMNGAFRLSAGDQYVFLSAIIFSIHILLIDHFSAKVDPVRLSALQFLACGGLSLIPMFLLESPSFSSLVSAAVPILYAGVLSCGVAYTLQVVAQRDTDPTVASLILSLESVFSALFGWIILGQTLSFRELAGCVLMFAAILLAQISE